MSLQRNRNLCLLVEEKRDEAATVNLIEFLSQRSPVDISTPLPVVPLYFNKDALLDFILHALAKQFENGIKFYVLDHLAKLDERICSFGTEPPLVFKLSLQLLLHFSKIASDETYDVRNKLEKNMAAICRDMLLPLDELPKFVVSPVSWSLKKFLKRPFILELFVGQLVRYKFTDLSMEKVATFIDSMIVCESRKSCWSMNGWSVIGGIVLIRGSLPIMTANHWANLYTLVLHETIHYLARSFSNNFGFSSPGKNSEFKDPDDKLAAEGRGLELGRGAEVELLGMQVDWDKTGADLAKKFVAEVECDDHSGPYLADDRSRLVPQEYPSTASSGMSIDFGDYYHQRFM